MISCLAKIPLLVSYLVLILSWLGFNVVSWSGVSSGVSILHFASQQIIFNWLWLMTVLSLLVASMRDPGKVETVSRVKEVKPAVKSIQPLKALGNSKWVYSRIGKDKASPLPIGKKERSVELENKPDWCDICDQWKPQRAHHCRSCGRCSLKMDHHCVWLGTCIGFHNYKPFLLFITYGSGLAIYAAIETIIETYRIAGSHFIQSADPAPVLSSLIAFLGVMMGMTVGSLASFHWWLTLRNMTTLESMPKRVQNRPKGHCLSKGRYKKLQREARSINIYDLGWRDNVRAVFGNRSKYLAGWPTIHAHKQGEGYFFDLDPAKEARLRWIERKLAHDPPSSSSSPVSALINVAVSFSPLPATPTDEYGDDELSD